LRIPGVPVSFAGFALFDDVAGFGVTGFDYVIISGNAFGVLKLGSLLCAGAPYLILVFHFWASVFQLMRL